MTTRHHPSLFITGVIAFTILAHNNDLKMQAAGAMILVVAIVAFMNCKSK